MPKVLVVDDTGQLLELFKVLLTMKGFEVETAGSKENLDKQLSQFTPDLILLDVRLNGHNGRALCKEIKEKANAYIPTILVSSNLAFLEEYEECGAIDIIEKPFDIKTVFEKIDRALRKDKI